MLRVAGLHAGYGQTGVLHGLDLEIARGECVALVGANGAGKTTTLSVISGLLGATAGSVEFDGRNITGLPAETVVGSGMAHVPEGRQLFWGMGVRDNLILGTYTLSSRERRERMSADLEKVYGIFPVLRDRSGQAAGTLSGGEQQMLAIGRALMSRPRLLLLDEPSMGLAPLITAEIFRVVSVLRDEGLTVLLVEQNARWAFAVSDRAYVMESGRVVCQGPSGELMKDKAVSDAYLGKGYEKRESGC